LTAFSIKNAARRSPRLSDKFGTTGLIFEFKILGFVRKWKFFTGQITVIENGDVFRQA